MKTGFLITARLKSERLKEKILLTINDKKIIEHIIDRSKQIKGIDGIVLCTSTNNQDKKLIEIAEKKQIAYFTGSENDVLDRLFNAAKVNKYDRFLNITADNPLFSIELSNKMIKVGNKYNPDFIFAQGMPIGTMPCYLNTEALGIAIIMKDNLDTEIWGLFVNRPDFFNIINIKVVNSPFKENIRITCDYPEDFKFISEIYAHFDKNEIPSMQKVFDVLKKHSNLLDINKNILQRMPNNETLIKLNQNFENKMLSGFEYAKKINKSLKPELKNLEYKI
jgi:spore coat polysaccharide biosynthesis protein SpsF